MFYETPEWAERHHYRHHSNPKSKSRAKTFFEKVHLRPTLTAAWEIVKAKNDPRLPDAWATIKKFDPKYSGADNANMLGGRLAQLIADKILLEGMDMGDAVKLAFEIYDAYKPREWDDGTDAAKTKQYREELPEVAANAIMGLREAMARENRIVGEIDLYEIIGGLALPHFTKPDYARRGDLKTKWSKKSATSKSGFANSSLPRHLGGMFEQAHVYQVAGFWALNGHQPPFLVYANKNDHMVFTPENAPELRDENLAVVVEDIKLYHKTTENLLRAAEHKDELFSLVSPDFSELCWQEPPAIVEEAKKIWKL